MYILCIKVLNSCALSPPGEIPPQQICCLYIYAYIRHIYAYMDIFPVYPYITPHFYPHMGVLCIFCICWTSYMPHRISMLARLIFSFAVTTVLLILLRALGIRGCWGRVRIMGLSW